MCASFTCPYSKDTLPLDRVAMHRTKSDQPAPRVTANPGHYTSLYCESELIEKWTLIPNTLYSVCVLCSTGTRNGYFRNTSSSEIFSLYGVAVLLLWVHCTQYRIRGMLTVHSPAPKFCRPCYGKNATPPAQCSVTQGL